MRREAYDEGIKQLEQLNRYEDILDVFINIVIKRSPTIFVLINMTLIIWLVQTIFSSNLQSIPNSIYFFVPFFKGYPISKIYLTNQTKCNSSFVELNLNLFPTIKSQHYKRKNLTYWKQDKTRFCIDQFTEQSNFSIHCQAPKHYCSGYCVDNYNQCPVTNIKKIRVGDHIPQGYTEFSRLSDQEIYILQRKNKESYVVGITALYDQKCAEVVKVFQSYDNFTQYWDTLQKCKSVDSLSSSIFKVFDTMPTPKYFQINGVMGPFINSKVDDSTTNLGMINLIGFKNDTQKCLEAKHESKNLDQYVFQNPVKPSFTQSLLIVCFIFFTGCWAWLIGFYCFDGKRKQKNMIVILMSIIELIVVTFTYTQNKQLFQAEKIVKNISQCLQNPEMRQVVKSNFGISSASPFLIIIYLCTAFLLVQLLCTLFDRFVYEPYYYDSHAN